RHLAEVDAALGDLEHAIALLEPLAPTADDPDIAALLGRLLTAAHRPDEALAWHAAAARRYEELVAAYPDAYGPHAAEFLLGGEGPVCLPSSRSAPALGGLGLGGW